MSREQVGVGAEPEERPGRRRRIRRGLALVLLGVLAAGIAAAIKRERFACEVSIMAPGAAASDQSLEPAQLLRFSGARRWFDRTIEVTATLTLQETGRLRGFVLKAGTDANANRSIETEEWKTVATATIREHGGVTTATIGPADVPLTCHVYRFEQDRSDEGIVWQDHFVDGVDSTSDG